MYSFIYQCGGDPVEGFISVGTGGSRVRYEAVDQAKPSFDLPQESGRDRCGSQVFEDNEPDLRQGAKRLISLQSSIAKHSTDVHFV